MGLLWGKGGKQQLGVVMLDLSTKHCNKLCVLSYLAGVAYLFALAFRGLNDGTYFSENALLPGLVQGARVKHCLD